MRPTILIAACAISLAGSAHAQDTGARPGNIIGTGNSLPRSDSASNISRANTASPIAPRLPTPETGDDAAPIRYLRDARAALAAGHTGEAQEALERAESRLLDRDVDPRRANDASRQPSVNAVERARRTLASGDRVATQRAIDEAISQVR